MLDKLSQKDTLWRRTALRICKDSFIADDLVQEMYLKLMNSQKECKDFYVILTIRSLYIDYLRKNKRSKEIYTDNINNFENLFEDVKEYDDSQQYKIDLIKQQSQWWEQELIELSNDYSLRELGKMYNIDHGLIFRIKNKVKNKVWEEIEKRSPKDLATQ